MFEQLTFRSGNDQVVFRSDLNLKAANIEHEAPSLNLDAVDLCSLRLRDIRHMHISKFLDQTAIINLRLTNKQLRMENPLRHFSPKGSDAFCQVIQAYLDGKITIKTLSLHRIKGVDEDGVYNMRRAIVRLKHFNKYENAPYVRKGLSVALVEEWPLLESGREELKRIFPEVLDIESLNALEKRASNFARIHATDETRQALERLANDALSDATSMTAAEKIAIAEHRNSSLSVKQSMLKRAIAHGRPNLVVRDGDYVKEGPAHYSPEVQSQALAVTRKLIVRNLIPKKEDQEEIVADVALLAKSYGCTPEIKTEAEELTKLFC